MEGTSFQTFLFYFLLKLLLIKIYKLQVKKNLTNNSVQMQNVKLSNWNFYGTLIGISLCCVCLY